MSPVAPSTRPPIPATDPTPRPSPPPWAVIVLGALTAFAPMSIDMYLPAFPAIGRDLGAGGAEVQLSLVVFFAGLALGQLVWGPVSDRLGRRGPLLAGIALYVAASIGCAQAGSIGALVAWRALQGWSGCAGIVLARSMVRDAFAPDQIARVFSRLTLVLGAAPVLAPLAGGWLAGHVGWRAVFGVLTVFGLACLAGAAALPETLPAGARSAHPRPGRAALATYIALLRDPGYVRYAAVGALTSAAMFAYIVAAPGVLISRFGVAPEHFGLYFGANAIGLIGASQVNHALLARRSPESLLRHGVATLLVGSGLLLAAAAASDLRLIVPALFVAIASLGFSGPNVVALALRHQAGRVGAAAAMLGSSQFWIAGTAGAAVSALPAGSAAAMAGVMTACAALALALLPAAPREAAAA